MEGMIAAAAGSAFPLACALALVGRSGAPSRMLVAFAFVAVLSRPIAALVEPALASALGGSWAASALAAALPESALVAACAATASRGVGGRGMWRAGAAAGLGLAAAEGVVYGLSGGMGTAAARILASMPAHAADGALAGGMAAWLVRRGRGLGASWGCGWAVACASHAAFDLLALSPAPWGGDAAAVLGWAACVCAFLLYRALGPGQEP